MVFRSKLTAEDREKIFKLSEDGLTTINIAKRYGISRVQVYRIIQAYAPKEVKISKEIKRIVNNVVKNKDAKVEDYIIDGNDDAEVDDTPYKPDESALDTQINNELATQTEDQAVLSAKNIVARQRAECERLHTVAKKLMQQVLKNPTYERKGKLYKYSLDQIIKMYESLVGACRTRQEIEYKAYFIKELVDKQLSLLTGVPDKDGNMHVVVHYDTPKDEDPIDIRQVYDNQR
jgi:hypothetical protein